MRIVCLFFMLFTVRVTAGVMLFGGNTDFQDNTSSLAFYNYRTYNPIEGRWTSRDPIEETVSINLFSYTSNNSIVKTDLYGLAYIGKRPLDFPIAGSIMYHLPTWVISPILPIILSEENLEPWHEQIIFEDNLSPSDIGFFSDNKIRADFTDIAYKKCCFEYPSNYDDSLMRIAVENVSKRKLSYKLLPTEQYNCQNFVEDVIFEYERLEYEEWFNKQNDFRISPRWFPQTVPVMN